MSAVSAAAASLSECPLFMDCVDEAPSESQVRANASQSAAFKEQMARLEEIARAGASVIRHDNGNVTFR